MKLFWYSALRLSGILAFQKLKNLTSCRTRMESMCQLAAFYRTRPNDCRNWLWFYKHQSLVTGEEHPTVITFDMALYEKAVQLVDARDDLKRTVFPSLGELHTVMAALRALGTSIENSGIDDAWLEAGVYGSGTIRQILKCAHYKRTLHAHIHMYMALYELLLETFFKENHTSKPSAPSQWINSRKLVQDHQQTKVRAKKTMNNWFKS